MKTILITSLFLITSYLLSAQVEFEKRIEFELDNGYSNEDIVEFGENGFVLYAYDIESSGKQDTWNYQLYNTDLEKEEATNIKVPEKFDIDDTWHNDDMLVTLFKNRKGYYILSSMDANTLNETRISGRLPKKAFIKNMTVFGDYAYFNMSIKKDKFLYSINRKTGKQDIIPVTIAGYKNKNISITHFQLLEETEEVFLYIRATKGKEIETYIMRLNDEGKKTDVFKLTGDINKNIIDISAQSIGDNTYLYTGTYSNKSTNYTEGVFFCKAKNNKVNFIKYYAYSELNNFFKYLPAKKQKKMEKKKKKKKAKGKTLKTKYYLSIHKMKQVEDGYIFLGEAYFPTFYTYTTTTYSNGTPHTTTHSVFDGYQYTHAVLAKFSNDGELIWDQVFKMYPVSKPFYVKRFISVEEKNEDDEIHFVFADGDEIITKAFDNEGNIIYDKKATAMKTEYKGDKSKWTISNLDYWYDHYFISYGSQKIKNKSGEKTKKGKKVKKKRKVFFISKIKYE